MLGTTATLKPEDGITPELHERAYLSFDKQERRVARGFWFSFSRMSAQRAQDWSYPSWSLWRILFFWSFHTSLGSYGTKYTVIENIKDVRAFTFSFRLIRILGFELRFFWRKKVRELIPNLGNEIQPPYPRFN